MNLQKLQQFYHFDLEHLVEHQDTHNKVDNIYFKIKLLLFIYDSITYISCNRGINCIISLAHQKLENNKFDYFIYIKYIYVFLMVYLSLQVLTTSIIFINHNNFIFLLIIIHLDKQFYLQKFITFWFHIQTLLRNLKDKLNSNSVFHYQRHYFMIM
jgi:hypothetical protein